MKSLLYLPLLVLAFSGFSQSEKVSTLDFVQIQNDNRDEAIFYYENNWLVLRKMALDRGFIDSYELIEVEYTEDTPFHLILKTTYSNKDDYELSEERFSKLIEEKGPLKLLNEKKSGDIRKVIFSKAESKHLFNN